MPTEKFAEVNGVAMAVADLAYARGGAAEMHAGVIEAVGEHKGLRPEHVAVKKSVEHGGVGLKARGHDQRSLFLLQLRHFRLKHCKQVEIAGDEARGAGARAIISRPCLGSLNQRRVEAKREIVVAGKIDKGVAADANGPRIACLDRGKVSPQALEAPLLEKSLVSAFVACHDPVLAQKRSFSQENQAHRFSKRSRTKPEQAGSEQASWKTPDAHRPFRKGGHLQKRTLS